MYKVILEPNAINDLFDILSFYQKEGGNYLADKIENRIVTQIYDLETMPNRCITSKFSDELKELVLQKLPYKVFLELMKTTKLFLL